MWLPLGSAFHMSGRSICSSFQKSTKRWILTSFFSIYFRMSIFHTISVNLFESTTFHSAYLQYQHSSDFLNENTNLTFKNLHCSDGVSNLNFKNKSWYLSRKVINKISNVISFCEKKERTKLWF